MKTKLSLLFVFLIAVQLSNGQISGNCVADAILSAYSERNYISEPVTDQQIDIILRCGIKAPSGMNRQPWKFTVINDEATMKDAINNIVPGNVIIIVSGVESPDGTTTPDLFACGLATGSMFIAAHGLGLGARIYAGPIGNVNSKKDLYQIPSGYKAVAMLRIGNLNKTTDAVSSASPRKTFEEIVNFKK